MGNRTHDKQDIKSPHPAIASRFVTFTEIVHRASYARAMGMVVVVVVVVMVMVVEVEVVEVVVVVVALITIPTFDAAPFIQSAERSIDFLFSLFNVEWRNVLLNGVAP